MNRKVVKQEIQNCTLDELEAWREHAVKCLNYFLKYRDEFEIEECKFVITHIDQRLDELKKEENFKQHSKKMDTRD